MIHTRKKHQLQIVQQILSGESNPAIWTEESLKSLLKGEVIIGYMLRNKKSTFDTSIYILNLYTINSQYLKTKDKIIKLDTLQNAFLQWLESLIEDSDSIMFRNPPIKEWLDTKENWCKGLAGRLAEKYYKPFDECLSAVYWVIMTCYNNSKVYLGNLAYIEIAANNKIKIQMRDMRNKLTGDHPLVINLDSSPSDYNGSLEDSIDSFHEIIAAPEPEFDPIEFEELMSNIKKDMAEEFSEREIDQIMNSPAGLPNSLYRKLLKWRKTHKRSDYL